MNNTNILLGRRIRALRKKKGFTQEELAEDIGTSSKYLGEIERGKVNFSVEIAEKISRGLGLKLINLFDFEHEQEAEAIREAIYEHVKAAGEKDLRIIYRLLGIILR